ncbi:ADP-ribosylation factor-like 6 interacting protein 1, isoform CRA_d [Mus musculus]|nr:ADP-ribosylation factor-like 6 interacting protein 1, isoform CRA_d [Mus musculus]
MAEGDNRSSNLLAVETASLEEQLQGWGEVMLMADKVLRWERAWFPPAIMGVVSLLFLIIYYLDPSVLSGVSCFVMFFCAVASWTKPTWDHSEVHWNGQKGDKQTSQAKRKEK